MVVYNKKTKETVKIAPIILFFIKELDRRLELRSSSISCGNSISFSMATKEHEYCYDALRLVEKTYKRKGWECKMSHYYRLEASKIFSYIWEFKKIVQK